MKNLIKNVPKFLFFTGKGGVGKTSMASSMSIALADSGKNILLISTDPASNLDEVLETKLTNTPTQVKSVSGLHSMNIDPMKAAEEYKESIIGPLRGLLPDETLASMEEELSGGCTIEVATFNVFSRIIGDKNKVKDYDHIILDTAPTGHTLRLLSLPAAWNEFIAENKTGTSCLGSISSIQDQKGYYEKAAEILKDASSTLLVMVTRPEIMSMKEAARASIELKEQGMRNQHLLINGVFESDSNDSTAVAFMKKSEDALKTMPESLKKLPNTKINFYPYGAVGIEALRGLYNSKALDSTDKNNMVSKKSEILNNLEHWKSMLNGLSENGKGVIMTMGKGGVGKTSMASAIALDLAERGHKVHLTTTDPAAHVADTVGNSSIDLKVTKIDPKFETEEYINKVLDDSKEQMSSEDLDLLEEEMRSPCIEEIAVFNAFAKAVSEGENNFLVMDTAPTGHTLLLLDATESYHKQVEKNAQGLSDNIKNLLPRLRNPEYTKVLITTLPEATPMHEAENLQNDLQRGGISPYGWIINQSFAITDTNDPLLNIRGNNELRHIDYITKELSNKTVASPWLPNNISGENNLKAIIADTY